MDIIGQNGNTGEHYLEEDEKKINDLVSKMSQKIDDSLDLNKDGVID